MAEEGRKKILLVDDQEEVITPLGKILEYHNYEVISTTKGAEAVKLAKQLKPDLIILDILMPDKDGGEVAAELGEDLSTKEIPIIFLTAVVGKDDEIPHVRAGRAHDIIAKPVTEGELLTAVKKTLVS